MLKNDKYYEKSPEISDKSSEEDKSSCEIINDTVKSSSASARNDEHVDAKNITPAVTDEPALKKSSPNDSLPQIKTSHKLPEEIKSLSEKSLSVSVRNDTHAESQNYPLKKPTVVKSSSKSDERTKGKSSKVRSSRLRGLTSDSEEQSIEERSTECIAKLMANYCLDMEISKQESVIIMEGWNKVLAFKTAFEEALLCK